MKLVLSFQILLMKSRIRIRICVLLSRTEDSLVELMENGMELLGFCAKKKKKYIFVLGMMPASFLSAIENLNWKNEIMYFTICKTLLKKLFSHKKI